jgi:hypothetical protein
MEITQEMRDELILIANDRKDFRKFGAVMSVQGELKNCKYLNKFVPEATEELLTALQKFSDTYRAQAEEWWPNWSSRDISEFQR